MMCRLFNLLVGCLFFSATFSHKVFSQDIERSVLSSAYHHSSNIGEWVIGETMIGDINGTQLQLSNGFLQGYSLSTTIALIAQSQFSLKVFPNPFSQVIHIRHDAPSLLFVEVRDIFGRLLFYQEDVNSDSSINLRSATSGTYYLKYQTNNSGQGILPIFKIQ